jgi:hypothetical protein
MTSKRRLAPSEIRYAAAHPGQTVRLTPTADGKVAAIRELQGGSFNQAVNSAIEGLDDAALEAAHARGHETGFQEGVRRARPPARAAGFAEAENIYRLTVPCHKCREPIELRLDDSTARSAIRVLTDAGFGHMICLTQPDIRSTPGSDVR